MLLCGCGRGWRQRLAGLGDTASGPVTLASQGLGTQLSWRPWHFKHGNMHTHSQALGSGAPGRWRQTLVRSPCGELARTHGLGPLS